MVHYLGILVVISIFSFNALCYPLKSNSKKLHFSNFSRVGLTTSDQVKVPSSALTFSKHPVGSAISSAECALCKYAMDVAIWKYKTPDRTYKGLFDLAISTCVDLNIESKNVCTGSINVMRNETLFILNNLNGTGEMVCGVIFPTMCQASDLSWNTDKWSVPLPKRDPSSKPSKKSSGSTFNVLQMSDIHIDLKYMRGAKVNCKEPLCCRQPANSGDELAGYWGSYGYCDVPYWTLENFFQHASKQKYDYILWTGDLPAHDIWNQSRSQQEYLLKNLTSLLLKYFPNTPIYPALGNHESYPVNSFPPNYIRGYNNISWLYYSLYKAWGPWLTSSALETVRRFGYYTLLVKPGLRLISLNMNYCNNQNFWMLKNPDDPDGELRWFVNTLFDAEKKGEVVHIIGHIPPSNEGDCVKVWRNNYYAVVNRFQDIIRGQFFGHTHNDQIEIMYSNVSLTQPISVAYISPSITTYTNLNPGYRTYTVDQQSWTVLDHQTYVLNLTKANQPQAVPEWEFEYSAKEAFNLTSLSAASWNLLYKKWLKEDKNYETLFQKYYRYFYKGRTPFSHCDKNCKRDLLCKIPGGNFTLCN